MEEVIYISSESEEEEVMRGYKEDKDDATLFVQSEWLPPELIDLTDQSFASLKQIYPRRDDCSVLEVTDLRKSNTGNANVQNIKKNSKHQTVPSFGKHLKSQPEKYGTYSECFEESVISKREINNLSHSHERIKNYLAMDTNCKSVLFSEHLNQQWSLEEYTTNISQDHFYKNVEMVTNADTMQHGEDAANHPQIDKCDRYLDLAVKVEDRVCSPYSLDSPYYCPSEIDDFFFSDSLDKSEESDHYFKASNNQHSSQTAVISSEIHPESTLNSFLLKKDDNSETANEDLVAQSHPGSSFTSRGIPISPTSTEILASDTGDNLPTYSSSDSSYRRILESSPPDFLKSLLKSPESPKSMNGEHQNLSDRSENNLQKRQYICLSEYRKLSQSVGAAPQKFKDEDEEGCLVAEPICRQHLSLVSCVMEEDYPEGIVQLLSDFIQPRHFPPVNITTHLLRAIFLDPTSTPFLAMEAFNLLMKTQRYHPVDKSNVPWDWELIKSVMKEQDEGSVSLRIDIRSMFLQYVLQCLEDDFKVNSQSLQQSLTKKMLSCGHQTFGQVREVITWMVNAAKESLNQEDSNKKDKHLKVVLSLQRMLSLALEVDKNPCFNSDKLAEALFVTLTRICSCRKKRLLVLNTVDSKLLKCKLLKLLLDETCFQKTHLPLSTDLIIHYLRSSMLPSDPCHEESKERKWIELLQLLWMLLLNYDAVETGHLLCPITKRSEKILTPSWTRFNQLKPSDVCEAANEFLKRAQCDIGHNISMETRDLLAHLQELI